MASGSDHKAETKKAPAKPSPEASQDANSNLSSSGAPAGLPVFLGGTANQNSSALPTFLGGGRPLDDTTRQFMEPRFGQDFSGVRVFDDEKAARSAKDAGAQAYTAGQNLTFARGAYKPGSYAGRRLLAHELAHVVQQSGGTGARLGYDAAEAEADRAASQVMSGNAVSPLTPVSGAVQRQAAPGAAIREDRTVILLTSFRDWVLPIQIDLDDDSAASFDANPDLENWLAGDLDALFNPPEGPLPETRRFLSGPRVKGLIEQDLAGWTSTRQLPSLATVLTARADVLRQQRVRADLENWLGVDSGTVDWGAEIPGLRVAFSAREIVTVGDEAQLDRAEMFLDILQNEVSGGPAIDGTVTPPDLENLTFKYATEAWAFDANISGLFSEKFLGPYLDKIAGLEFVPAGFDLQQFAPQGTDIAESRRENLIDRFIYAEAEGLATAFLLDRWTTAGVDPEVYLKSMDLDKEQDAVIDYLTDEFMKRAANDPELASSIRDQAADQARYELLSDIVQLGHRNEQFNQSLPPLQLLTEDQLDEQQTAIIHDPWGFYQTSYYLAQAIQTVLGGVSAGANVAVAALESAQAIAGKADIPKNFGTFVFLFEIGTQIKNLKDVMNSQRNVARERFAGRMRPSWGKIAETLRNFGKEADEFIEKKWIPTLKKIAQERIDKNYADILNWKNHFKTETPNVVARYRLAAFALEDVANALESGEEKTATMQGESFDAKDVPNMRITVEYLRGKADKLEDPKGQEEKLDELQDAVDAYEDVKEGIESGKYKPNHYGEEVRREAMQRLGIGDFEPGSVTTGMVLYRQAVVSKNPFERWAVARYEFFELYYEHLDEIEKFAIVGLLTIASFLVPGVAAAVLFVVDTGYGIYQAAKGKAQAQATLDMARLDTDLDIQGVTVEQAKEALHSANVGLFLAIALAGVVPAFIVIRRVASSIQATRMLNALTESNPALAARIVEGAGSTRMASRLLGHFAGDAESLAAALEHVNDGQRLDSLIGKVKDAHLALALLNKAGGEAGLAPLLSRFKSYAKLEQVLGKGVSAERLASLCDLASGEKNVFRLLDVMEAGEAEALLNGGLSTDQALAVNILPPSARANYLTLLGSGDAAIREGLRDLLRVNAHGRFESAVVEETLQTTARFMEHAKGPAGADYVKRFENIAEEEQKLDVARKKLAEVTKAGGNKALAKAEVKRLADNVAKVREANYPGKIRVVDVTPEELQASPALQTELAEQLEAVQQRQLTEVKGVLEQLGIHDGEVYNQLKRPTRDELMQGVLAKMIDRKGYKHVWQMDDMVRGRFNLETAQQVEEVAAELERRGGNLQGPKPAAGVTDVPGGYPRYHVIMKDAATGITHEWQIGTKATTKLFEAPDTEVAPIELWGVRLPEGSHANLHDIEYDVFGRMQLSKDPAEQRLAKELGIPQFRKKVAETAAETGKLGSNTPHLTERIRELHEEASRIMKELVHRKGTAYVENFFPH